MTEVIGVRFRTAGKVYYFGPAGNEIKRGNYVIVETSRGVEMGKVVVAPHLVEDSEVIQPLRDILRVASREDLDQAAENRAKEKSSFHVCKQKIREHNLDMKLIDAEYTFDGSKLLFYFTADGRVDFRELVKDLAAIFRTRIELRQIGVRDETKILGGLGICGRVLCCHAYLSDFVPVTIKMAKDQSLSLNPTKISGTCGRLMCCLKNEQDIYEELNRQLPNIGDYITTADGISGKVQNVNVLRQLIRIVVEKGEEKEVQEITASQIVSRIKKGKKPKVNEVDEAELKSLLDLEDENQNKDNQNKKSEKKKHEKNIELSEGDGASKKHQFKNNQKHHDKNNENKPRYEKNNEAAGSVKNNEPKVHRDKNNENVSRDRVRHDRDKKHFEHKNAGAGKKPFRKRDNQSRKPSGEKDA